MTRKHITTIINDIHMQIELEAAAGSIIFWLILVPILHQVLALDSPC